MFAIGFIAFIGLAVLGAWLMLQFEIAEATLILIVMVAFALGIYWTFIGGWGNETVRGVGAFILLLVTLGFVRLGAEKLNDILVRKARHLSHSSHTQTGPQIPLG